MKKAVRFAVFLIITLIVLLVTSRIILLSLRNPNNREFNHEEFYKLEENSIDVLFVGASHAYCGFIPSKLYEEFGLSSYNLATSNQSMLANYLWAKEAYRTQKYKVLVVEGMSFPNSHGDISNDIRSLSSMGLSPHYLELCKTYKRNFYKILFPVFEFHNNWEELQTANFKKDIYEMTPYMRGYVPIVSRAGDNSYQIVDETDDEVGYLKFPYADKIIEFCRENEIELIFVKAPLARNDVNNWNTGYSNRAAQYCAENNVPFYDFNAESVAALADIHADEDVAADGRHANYYGALKMTKFIGNLLTEEHGADYWTGTFDDSLVKRFNNYMTQFMEENSAQ